MSTRAAVTSKQLLRVLELNGWEVVRHTGSHRFLRKAGAADLITVPVHRAKDVLAPGIVKNALRTAGLGHDALGQGRQARLAAREALS